MSRANAWCSGETFWDPEIQTAFEQLPGATRNKLKLDPWIVDQLDAFLQPACMRSMSRRWRRGAAHRTGSGAARGAATRLARAPPGAGGGPIAEVACKLGGELAPFQWAAGRYALDARRTFLADEQGLGKTVEALAACWRPRRRSRR